MKWLIEYYKPTGKFYTSAEIDVDLGFDWDVVAKIRGLRDNGGPDALPGLSGDGWDGPIRVSDPNGTASRVLLPRWADDYYKRTFG